MSYEDFYRTYLPSLKGNGKQKRAICPFCEHKDGFSVNIETGQCKCFHADCLFDGDVFDFLENHRYLSFAEAKKELAKYGIKPFKNNLPLSPSRKKSNRKRPSLTENQIRDYVEALPDAGFQFLRVVRGISKEIIEKYRLGYHEEKKRYSIPVMQGGECVNIRLYLPKKKPKFLPISPGRSIQLYPEDQLQNEEVWLCEGEFDALSGISHGLKCITVTGGAGSWKDEFTGFFEGKKVNIVYDCDEGGKKGAEKIAEILSRVAEIKVIDLGLGEGEDLTDWFVKYRKSKEEIERLAEDTSLYEKKLPYPININEKTSKKKPTTKTLIPNLIHLVSDDGKVKYLLKKEGTLVIEETYLEDGKIYVPSQNLPIEFLKPNIVEEKMSIKYSEVLDQVVSFLESYIEMPEDWHYFILALWVFHTYLIEKFNATPFLYFYGQRATGKTRAGEILNKLAYKSTMLTSATQATLFRSADYFKTALVIDEIRLWGKEGNQEIASLIKSRYKRGLAVSRINLEKKGEDQIEYFDVFGPLVMCTTEGIPLDIEDRSLIFVMQSNIRKNVESVIDEELAAKLRNKLTVFRANLFEKKLPQPKPIARRRLNEIISPLHQVLLEIAPGRVEELRDIVEEINKQRETEERSELEENIIRIIKKLYEEHRREVFLTSDIVESLNKDRPEKEKISSTLVGRRLKRMGFDKTRESGTGRMGFMFNRKKLEYLTKKYDL